MATAFCCCWSLVVLQVCNLVAQLMRSRSRITLGRDQEFRNQLLPWIISWTSDSSLEEGGSSLLQKEEAKQDAERDALLSTLDVYTDHFSPVALPYQRKSNQWARQCVEVSRAHALAALDLACLEAVQLLLDGLVLQSVSMKKRLGLPVSRRLRASTSVSNSLRRGGVGRMEGHSVRRSHSNRLGLQVMEERGRSPGARSRVFVRYLSFFSRVLGRCWLFSLVQLRERQRSSRAPPPSQQELVQELRGRAVQSLVHMLLANMDAGFGHLVRLVISGHSVQLSTAALPASWEGQSLLDLRLQQHRELLEKAVLVASRVASMQVRGRGQGWVAGGAGCTFCPVFVGVPFKFSTGMPLLVMS